MSKQIKKLTSVEIRYKYNTDEWERISVGYEDGRRVDITREQIEAFKRMHKVLEDLQEIERLSKQLTEIFGTKKRIDEGS